MSKFYDLYLEKKKEDSKKIYFFKNGMFYICLGDDAIFLNKEFGLKLVQFSKETMKCGFPYQEIERYLKFTKLLGYNYEVVLNSAEQVIEDIKAMDDNISKNDAFIKLKYYKRILKDEIKQ